MDDIDHIFQSFRNKKVLIIGDVMIDSYIWGGVERISPEAPVPIVKITRREYRLGGAANVALNIQSLGATPFLCAVVGEDEPGNRLKERLIEWELTDEGIFTSSERPTTVKTRVLSGHQHVVRVDEETDRTLDEQEEKGLLANILTLIPHMDVVIFEDYDKGVITENIIRRVVSEAHTNNVQVAVDPKKRNFLLYRDVDLFKPNLKELKEGLNLNFEKKDQAAVTKAVQILKGNLNAKAVLVTLSEYGVYISDDDQHHFIKAHEREISDVSGAGDTVISVAALCMATGLSIEKVAHLANLAGGLVCEHLGVVPIDRETFYGEAKKLAFFMD